MIQLSKFLQGPETDPATVRKIRDAIDNRKDVTVQLINYTKTGKNFWNLFHLQLMCDQKIRDFVKEVQNEFLKPGFNSFGLGDCKAPKGLGSIVESIVGSIVESIVGSI